MYLFTIYIILSGHFLFYINADLFSGFLWVIDFNLLFIFLLVGLYLLHLFKNDSKKINNNYISIIKLMYLMLMFTIIFILNPMNINLSHLNINWVITHLMYYSFYLYNIKTNLFILYITYFKLNIDLFLIINIMLFFSIILSIYLFLNINLLKLKSVYNYKSNKYNNIQKLQNMTIQKHKTINFVYFN